MSLVGIYYRRRPLLLCLEAWRWKMEGGENMHLHFLDMGLCDWSEFGLAIASVNCNGRITLFISNTAEFSTKARFNTLSRRFSHLPVNVAMPFSYIWIECSLCGDCHWTIEHCSLESSELLGQGQVSLQWSSYITPGIIS